jgi:hypothetical protein
MPCQPILQPTVKTNVPDPSMPYVLKMLLRCWLWQFWPQARVAKCNILLPYDITVTVLVLNEIVGHGHSPTDISEAKMPAMAV